VRRGEIPSTRLAEGYSAILNAPVLTALVRPCQSVGAFGPRDFDKYVWYVPIPQYDANDDRHRQLVDLGIKGETVCEAVELPEGVGFQRARGLLRAALEEAGIAEALDAAVRALLPPSAIVEED
jgi:hypothetical protein